jgi:glucose/arabinose dehydrogenase
MRFIRSLLRRPARLAPALLLVSACGGGGGAVQDTPLPTVSVTRIASGLVQPVHIGHAGDGSGRLFVVERQGVIRIVRNGAVLPDPFLDIRALVRSSGGEQGLLSVAFPPDFATRRHFYVYYTGQSGIGGTVLARYRVGTDPDRADPASAAILLGVSQPFANHNGGQLAFGPDGLLYVGLGDGGSAGDPQGNAQNPASLLGKLLRLEVESGVLPYAIPAGNPFGDEIWALGLRNPWRFSFDRATGDLYIGDVGQGAFEEVNVQPAASPGGENYGWDVMEGLHCFGSATCSQAGLILPVAEYGHDEGDCSVTGGFVYRGTEHPALRGIYLYGDFCSGRIWGLRRTGTGWRNQLLLDSNLRIASFGEDEAGNLYLADLAGGELYRVGLP